MKKTKIELTEEHVNLLWNVINETSFKGQIAEMVVELKKALKPKNI